MCEIFLLLGFVVSMRFYTSWLVYTILTIVFTLAPLLGLFFSVNTSSLYVLFLTFLTKGEINLLVLLLFVQFFFFNRVLFVSLVKGFLLLYTNSILSTSSLYYWDFFFISTEVKDAALLNGLFYFHPWLLTVVYSIVYSCFFYSSWWPGKKNFFVTFFFYELYSRYYLLLTLILFAALVSGGWWAQQELSWGGWWAWDIVEYANLLLFIFLLCFVHIHFYYRQQLLSNLLNILVWLVLTIVCVVRYEFITSIHSFLSLSIINQYFLYFFIIFIFILLCVLTTHIYSLFLYFYNYTSSSMSIIFFLFTWLVLGLWVLALFLRENAFIFSTFYILPVLFFVIIWSCWYESLLFFSWLAPLALVLLSWPYFRYFIKFRFLHFIIFFSILVYFYFMSLHLLLPVYRDALVGYFQTSQSSLLYNLTHYVVSLLNSSLQNLTKTSLYIYEDSYLFFNYSTFSTYKFTTTIHNLNLPILVLSFFAYIGVYIVKKPRSLIV